MPIFRACKNAKFALQHPIIFGVFASPWTTLKTEKRKFALSWEMKSVSGHLKHRFIHAFTPLWSLQWAWLFSVCNRGWERKKKATFSPLGFLRTLKKTWGRPVGSTLSSCSSLPLPFTLCRILPIYSVERFFSLMNTRGGGGGESERAKWREIKRGATKNTGLMKLKTDFFPCPTLLHVVFVVAPGSAASQHAFEHD